MLKKQKPEIKKIDVNSFEATFPRKKFYIIRVSYSSRSIKRKKNYESYLANSRNWTAKKTKLDKLFINVKCRFSELLC
jgi:hypothetical protein